MHYKYYYCTGFYTSNIVLEPNSVFLNWLSSTATWFFVHYLEQESYFPVSSIPKQIPISN